MKRISDYMHFFKNKKGELSIIQFPNFLLISWLILILVGIFIGSGSLKSNVQHLSSSVLFAWAYLEMTTGESYFRRLLGGLLLASVAIGYFIN